MRSSRPSEANPVTVPKWQELGWPHPPRNGQEWKRVKDGLGPVERDVVRRCRKCGGKNYRLEGRQRRCQDCAKQWRLAYDKKYPGLRKRYQDRWYQRQRKYSPEKNVEGITTITQGWLSGHIREVADRVEAGEKFIVTLYGSPGYGLVSVEDMRRYV